MHVGTLNRACRQEHAVIHTLQGFRRFGRANRRANERKGAAQGFLSVHFSPICANRYMLDSFSMKPDKRERRAGYSSRLFARLKY